ncbi:MAG: ribosome small subunit-dependent GTPase A [Bacillota bacterium]
MTRGIIVKALSGFFYVQGSDGRITECRGRGRFRKLDTDLLVGDLVHFEETEDGRGVVNELVPRRMRLLRPPIANVDQAVFTFAFVKPPLHREMLDRLLVLAEREQVQSLIVCNKVDLASPEEIREVMEVYGLAGYPVVLTSVKQESGIKGLREHLAGKISVLAGPSGVGKSSLLNAVSPGLSLTTGAVSEKIGRGRHTTRHVELLPLANGGMVADTPGFYDLSVEGIKSRELAALFPEMRPVLNLCRFGASCLHDKEPDCAVKALIADGLLARSRYESYLSLLSEAKVNERRY